MIVRKFFHFIILGIILAGMISEEFLKKVLALVFFAFVTVEFIRSTLKDEIPLVKSIHNFLKPYTDMRDSDKLIATHIYLLFG
jgi:dolichol kinase